MDVKEENFNQQPANHPSAPCETAFVNFLEVNRKFQKLLLKNCAKKLRRCLRVDLQSLSSPARTFQTVILWNIWTWTTISKKLFWPKMTSDKIFFFWGQWKVPTKESFRFFHKYLKAKTIYMCFDHAYKKMRFRSCQWIFLFQKFPSQILSLSYQSLEYPPPT